MIALFWWLIGYGVIDDIKTPEQIIEKIKEKNIEVRSKELTYANVIAELKERGFKPVKFVKKEVIKIEELKSSKLDLL